MRILGVLLHLFLGLVFVCCAFYVFLDFFMCFGGYILEMDKIFGERRQAIVW